MGGARASKTDAKAPSPRRTRVAEIWTFLSFRSFVDPCETLKRYMMAKRALSDVVGGRSRATEEMVPKPRSWHGRYCR